MKYFDRYARRGSASVARLLRLAAVLGVTALLLCAACGHRSASTDDYYCPMHPTYVADRPGDCPICNMRLLKRSKPSPGSTPAPRDTLPHDAPGAAPAAPGVRPAASGKPLYYRNPMDPRVTSPVPARDAMGMDYVPVYADSSRAPSASDVPGYAPVTLDEQSMRLAGVETAAVEIAPLTRQVRTVGLVVPDESRLHHMHVKVGGFVEQLYINATGQHVQAGQPAFSLYAPELLASQNEFLAARRAADELAASSSAAARQAAGELLAAARRRLELFDVPAGFIEDLVQRGTAQRTVTMLAHASGYVTEKNVVEGQRVEPGVELFTITDLSRVWVEADFYESEALLVHVGDRAVIDLPYEPGRTLDGQVEYVYPYFDPAARTLKVRFAFPNPALTLKPSMYVDVWLAVESPPGLVVPASAVFDSGTRQIIFVETSAGHFQPRRVQVGARSDGRVQLLGGVQVGERVAMRANFLLDSESRLRGAWTSATEASPGGQP